MFETIVALATPPLKSALAIIRLSGDDCFNIVSKCFSKDITKLDKKAIMFGSIIKDNKKIDDVVLCAYKGPKSFTGEDSVEISCHGSMIIVNEIIELLLSKGARLATNGEFSSRAFIHQKIDLIQAEAINDLINATTVEAKNISLLALDKQVSNRLILLKKRLADLIALIAVNVDYPEYEDIEIANKDKVKKECEEIIVLINSLIKDSQKSKIIKDGINVAIVGRPNVGKSSLLNALIGENKAIVTNIAGTTRDIVEGEAIIDGVKLHFLDTAGIRTSKNKIEIIGVEKSKKAMNNADLILFVFDAKIGIQEEDLKIADLMDKNKIILVANKSDLKPNNSSGVNISAKNSDINSLKKEISKFLGIKPVDFRTPALNNIRQISLLENAVENLYEALKQIKLNSPMDLVNYPLISAHNNLLEILGENNQTDLVKEIFSRFCLGK